MRFLWDRRKSRTNLAKHKVSFEIAQLVFGDSHALSVPDDAEAEERWLTLGLVSESILLVVVHTFREQENDEEEIRIISARKATKEEREWYEQARSGE